MAATSGSVERQQWLEGIVTYCDDRLARIWIEDVKREKEISFAYRSRHFNLGDWLSVSLTTDEVHIITPVLRTRVLKIGVTQVRTEVIFRSDNEKIGHGTIIQSKHFDRVAVFTPFTGIIMDRIYRVYVERIPRDRRWNELESGTYWFVPSNQTPELVSVDKHPASDTQLIGPLVGVVVSKAMRFAFVWTPVLGEGICENHGNLMVGGWIKFMAESTTFISHWPMNNLTVDWIGPVADRNGMLEKAVCSFGVGKTYGVMLKRLKKSLEEPITTWNVHQVLDCTNKSRRDGIVCSVYIQKSLALVYIKDAGCGNGRILSVDLKIFDAVPALGDWFSFEIDKESQFCRVLSVMKSEKLCASHIFNGQLEVETEVILTNKISTKGHRVLFSTVLGAVVDDANKLSNITLDTSKKYTVWCTTMRATVPDDPYWRITNFSTLPMWNHALITKPELNINTKKVYDISYVGVVVGGCRTGYFVWTPSLAEIICHHKDGLRIGDWIRFWIRRKQRAHPSGKPFCINTWQKLDSLYSAREENNTAVVTVELKISEKYNSQKPPLLPFFGEVLDKKHCFGAHVDDIRGHIIEMDIKRVRNEKYVASWDITFVLVKNSSTSDATVLSSDLSLPVSKSIIGEYNSLPEFEWKNDGNHSPTCNEEKKEHGEHHHGRNDQEKEDIELDPVICSMKLLFMSKEVREAIKMNCMEEYTILRQHFDFVS